MAFFRCKGCQNVYRAYIAIENGLPTMRDMVVCPHCDEDITVLNEVQRPREFDRLVDKRPETAAKLYPLLSS
jgi:uncharacterized protein YbaR (Trm112 family)